jgi:hypothetical protein
MSDIKVGAASSTYRWVRDPGILFFREQISGETTRICAVVAMDATFGGDGD